MATPANDNANDTMEKAIRIFCVGILLAGATSVLAYLDMGETLSLCYGVLEILGLLLMVVGTFGTGACAGSGLFKGAGVLILLSCLIKIGLLVVATLGRWNSSEQVVRIVFGATIAAAFLVILGVILVLVAGRLTGDEEKKPGAAIAVVAGIAYALAQIGSVAVPVAASVLFGGQDKTVVIMVISAAGFLFLASLLVAIAIQRAAGGEAAAGKS